MSRLDNFDEILNSYDGREYHEENKADDAWETLQNIFGKEKLAKLDERSKANFIEVYSTARELSKTKQEPAYVDKICEAIAGILNDNRLYKNSHAVAVWHKLNMDRLEIIKNEQTR